METTLGTTGVQRTFDHLEGVGPAFYIFLMQPIFERLKLASSRFFREMGVLEMRPGG